MAMEPERNVDPQPAAADVGAPSGIAGDDLGHRVAGTEEERPDDRDPRDEERELPSDTGTTRGGAAGGPEPPPV